MKKIILLITTSFTFLANAQTFPVGHMSINFKDVSRTSTGYSISGGITTNTATGRNIGTEVYYPATTTGTNTSVASGQFPVVVFGHGFVMTYDNYDNIFNRLAALGYIVLLPRTEGSTSPVHADFGADLAFLASAGMNLNAASSNTLLNTFNGKVIQKSAIGGHSMGAGSSFLGAASNSTITCLFNMCAATTNPSSINSASLVTVPTLMISGEMDSVADTTVQNSHFTAIVSTKKFHVIITGAKHCDFGNGTSFLCTFGQPACTGTGCNATLFNRYMSYLEPFLANQLKSDCTAGNAFMSLIQNPSADRAGRKITGSIACVSTGIQSESLFSNFSVFPNPTTNKLIISFNAKATTAVLFELYDISGRLVLSTGESVISSVIKKELNLEALDNGTYILYVRQDNFKTAYRILKQ
ncbi:MAG: T9SS type A sorting domain-containing protein [Burkholderiales bacterium]|nr:T9SS type A sorting domain-containing protein [Bacteroidia bacterium]